MAYQRIGPYLRAGSEGEPAIMSGGAAAAMLLGLGALFVAYATAGLLFRAVGRLRPGRDA